MFLQKIIKKLKHLHTIKLRKFRQTFVRPLLNMVHILIEILLILNSSNIYFNNLKLLLEIANYEIHACFGQILCN